METWNREELYTEVWEQPRACVQSERCAMQAHHFVRLYPASAALTVCRPATDCPDVASVNGYEAALLVSLILVSKTSSDTKPVRLVREPEILA